MARMETTNPGRVGEDGYETAKFAYLPKGELFWLNTEKSDANHAHRKLNEEEALNIKLQETMTFNRHQNVFYKM